VQRSAAHCIATSSQRIASQTIRAPCSAAQRIASHPVHHLAPRECNRPRAAHCIANNPPRIARRARCASSAARRTRHVFVVQLVLSSEIWNCVPGSNPGENFRIFSIFVIFFTHKKKKTQNFDFRGKKKYL
jgi:hypothetical protein